MESAKQLRKVISEYRKNALSGGFPGDDQLGKVIEAETLNDPNAPPLAKFLCGMGTKGGAGIVAMTRVWQFRDEIIEYQKHHNISSVFWNELDWMGEKIRFPISSDDLEFMPQDGPILTRHKLPTIDKFVDFICRHKLESLLCQDDEEEDVPVTLPQVYAQAKQYATARLSGGIEQPVYMAQESDQHGGISVSKEIAYHLTEFGLWLDPLPTPLNPDPEGIYFSVKIYRYE